MYQLFACGCPAGHSLPTTGLADPVNLSFDMQKTGTFIFTRVRGRKRHQHSECLFCQYQDTKIRIYFAFLLERIDFQLGGEEVPKTAMSELNWIHEFFYNKWDFPNVTEIINFSILPEKMLDLVVAGLQHFTQEVAIEWRTWRLQTSAIFQQNLVQRSVHRDCLF